MADSRHAQVQQPVDTLRQCLQGMHDFHTRHQHAECEPATASGLAWQHWDCPAPWPAESAWTGLQAGLTGFWAGWSAREVAARTAGTQEAFSEELQHAGRQGMQLMLAEESLS